MTPMSNCIIYIPNQLSKWVPLCWAALPGTGAWHVRLLPTAHQVCGPPPVLLAQEPRAWERTALSLRGRHLQPVVKISGKWKLCGWWVLKLQGSVKHNSVDITLTNIWSDISNLDTSALTNDLRLHIMINSNSYCHPFGQQLWKSY